MDNKKSCGIITFHEAVNYGAVLQAYALKKVISRYCDVHFVRHSNSAILNRNSISPGFPKSIAGLKRFIIKSLTYFPNRKKHNFFTRFRNQYLLDTPEKYADFYITGSDQVWNDKCTDFDKAYFLDFTDDKKKNSYSASFGFDSVPEDKIDEYRRLLGGFNNISVREKTGKDIISDLIERDVRVTLDPTLLLSKEEWSELVRQVDSYGKYLLVYAFEITDKMAEFVNKIAEERNLCVLILLPEKSLWKKSPIKNAKFVNYVSPEEWVSFFYYADFIVTNSFHGTVFSINFNKQFAVELLPPPSKVNSRLTDVLDMFELNTRYISSSDIRVNVDFERCNSIMQAKREESVSYLKSIIEEYNE